MENFEFYSPTCFVFGKDTETRVGEYVKRFGGLYIHGTKGSIRSDVEYNQDGEVSYTICTDEGTTERKVSVPQNYSLEIEQLSRCILYGEKPFVTPEFSIRNASLMDQVFSEIGY